MRCSIMTYNLKVQAASDLTGKHKTWFKRLVMDKHASLFVSAVGDEEKKSFMTMWTDRLVNSILW